MTRTPIWRRYLRFFGPDVEADVDDELRFHLDTQVDELIAEGWTPEAARAEAQRRFGNVVSVREICQRVANQREKKMNYAEWIATCWQDVKYAARQLRRHGPGSTLFAMLTLGVGIGAVTSVFSIVYAVLLRPLPFPAPERLVTVWSTREGTDDVVTPRNFDSWRRESHSFSRLGALQRSTFTLSEAGRAMQVPGAFASADFFRVFGLSPELGRTFTDDEDRRPRPHLVILSHRLWQARFGGNRQILDAQIRLNREPYTVIGIMPPGFSLRADSEQLWVPLALSGQEMSWMGGVLSVVGRLQPDVTRKQAQAEMKVLARNLEVRYPEMNRGRGIRIGDYAADLIGDYRQKLLVLLGAVGFVLLIACSNVANLLLARGAGRTQELGVRTALGATRVRIIRQLLTESLLVALFGAGLGLVSAECLASTVRTLGTDAIPRLDEARVNSVVFLFALTLAVLSTLLSGVLPAIRAAQVDIQTVLRQGGRGTAGLVRDHARSAYITAQVALALVLLVGAGLLIRTAVAAARVRPGFSPQHVLTGRTALPSSTYKTAEQVVLAYEHILEAARNQSGVVSAALASKIPLGTSTVGLALKPGSVSGTLKEDFATELRYISAGYFSTMEIPLRRGREFTPHDRAGSMQVAIINETLARRLWSRRDPIGQPLRLPELDTGNAVWEVIGVAADVRDNGLMTEPPPALYLPFAQVSINPWHWVEQSLYVVARTRTDPSGVSDPLRAALRTVDSELPLGDVRTMEERLSQSISVARFYALLLTTLGLCGLLLTAAGIYGVVAYFVSRQRSEIGVRLALGSTPGRVLLLVVRQGMRPVTIGIALGLLGALTIGRLMANQLYGVTPADPTTLAAVAGVLVGVAALACYLPARQAAQLDPMIALRSE